MSRYPKEITFTEKMKDNFYEYRSVLLPRDKKEIFVNKFKCKLLKEEEVIELGIIQSKGWEHYLVYKPEPYVILFRRILGTNPTTGEVDELTKKQVEEWEKVRSLYV